MLGASFKTSGLLYCSNSLACVCVLFDKCQAVIVVIFFIACHFIFVWCSFLPKKERCLVVNVKASLQSKSIYCKNQGCILPWELAKITGDSPCLSNWFYTILMMALNKSQLLFVLNLTPSKYTRKMSSSVAHASLWAVSHWCIDKHVLVVW